MTNGLSINIKEFNTLPQKDQLTILYKNTEELKSLIKGYRFQLKLHYIWLVGLSVALGVGKYFSFF